MSTQISKKDVPDLASSIVDTIIDKLVMPSSGQAIQQVMRKVWTDTIEECISDWISECETEDAEYRKGQE